MVNKIGYDYLKSELSRLNIITVPSVANFITTVWPSQKKANLIKAELFIELNQVSPNLINSKPDCAKLNSSCIKLILARLSLFGH